MEKLKLITPKSLLGKDQVGIVDRKDEHCYKHKIDFENECHKTFTGKTIWIGCPQCRLEIDKREPNIIKPKQSIDQVYVSPVKRAKGF